MRLASLYLSLFLSLLLWQTASATPDSPAVAQDTAVTLAPLNTEPEPEANNAKNKVAAPAPQQAGDSSSLWLILFGLSALGNVGLFFAWRKAAGETSPQGAVGLPPSNSKTAETELRQTLEKARQAQREAESKLARLQGEVQDLKQNNERMSKEIAFYENKARQDSLAQQQQKQPPQEQTPPVVQHGQQPVPHTGSGLKLYLYAPAGGGVFYSNSVQTGINNETLYELSLSHEQAEEGSFKLISDPAVLSRAEAMAQQLLLPVCEIQGRGPIPANPNQVPGKLRREGAGWRVVQKMQLKW